MDNLDHRIVPAGLHSDVVAVADLAGAGVALHSQQGRAQVESAEIQATIRRERRIVRLAERHEKAVLRRELRAERRAALHEARHQTAIDFPPQIQVAPETDTIPSTAATAATGPRGANNESTSPGSGAMGSTATPANEPTVTSSGSSTPTNPLPDNVSVLLDAIYEEYEAGDLTASTAPGQVEVQGTSVGVNIHAASASDFATMVTALENLGLQVGAVSDADDVVEGLLPIAQLPAASQVVGSPAIAPVLYPNSSAGEMTTGTYF
jgi:hypothetical protein